MLDLIIIGAGTAGIAAYKEAVKYTQNLLIINDGPWDTTCARVGCMPSKVLISSANRLYDIQHANEVGLTIKTEIDTTQIMTHVRQLRDRFTKATLKDVESWDNSHKISGKAKFINHNTIEVNQQQFQAKNFIIAVGSTPNFDSEWKKELQERLITSDQIFELEKLPKSLAVIGSGVIAIELAQAMQRLGVETTVFARSQKVGALSSPQLQELAQLTLSQELNILFKTLPQKVEKTTQGVKIHYSQNNENKKLEVDYLLVATGRQSLLNTLSLENIHPEYQDLKKLPINTQTKQLANLPIFIVGDAFTNTPIQHEAAHEGRMAAHNCLNTPIKNIKTLTPLAIMFSSPEMATVGQSYQALKEQEIDFITGFASYQKQGRALVLGKNKGAIEVYIDKKSKKLLGAELFVESAEHMAHLLSWMIAEEVTLDDLLIKPFYHPTLEEGLRTALKHARRQLD
ncbi:MULTISPECIES: dihydrolipoyl dehydrogenase [unclassified Acinetobacter]|uniref:dihydrolipoyl dehydrogenase n=1 Tax=unclassified Acinetobacter TaxID=196816 RepID=UPI002575F39A|nr:MULTISPECIES: dihydrolipoyl dehydrogenase [unclassified Acinetobacter]MDM1765069.1 dihydrolipoyl dehydrogenase [Acinetobacter sp. 226-1]MDM1768306.1 dihydrolipoyl dehydrogenase [Acinetobacter sp. 226-4]